MKMAITDELGEIRSIVEGAKKEFIDMNTPDGCTARDFPEDVDSYWLDGWVSKGIRPSQHYSWDPITKAWVDHRSMTDHQAAAWERIKIARAAAESAPLVVDGLTFDADATSRQLIAGAVQMASLAIAAGNGSDFQIEWTLADNSAAILTAAQTVNLGIALGTQVSAAHATARTLREQIVAATTVEQVESVVWPPP